MNDNIKNDRDLILIFARIYLFIKRYYIILLIFLIAGIGYGIYRNNTAGYFYKKHLIISSIVIEKEISTDIIMSIQMLIEKNNTSVLAQMLNIPEVAAASMLNIDTATYNNRKNIGFVVDLSFRDSVYADTITSGIMYFLNHNEYFRKNIQLFIEEKQTILETVNKKLILTDSIHESSNPIYSSTRGENLVLLKSSSTEQIRLIEEKYRIERDIEFGSKISLVDDTMSKSSAGIGLGKSIILYGLFFGILGVILSLFIESFRLTRKLVKQK